MRSHSLLFFIIILLIPVIIFRKNIKNKFFLKNKKYVLTKVVSHKDKKIIKLLIGAYADEWLAYYQYLVGSNVVRGDLAQEAIKELVQHANDEKRHADMLTKHIIDLGGLPILDFADLLKISGCGYLVPPVNGDIKIILEQNIEGERCAIKFYKDLLERVSEYPELSKDIAVILKDEEEHERDLIEILNKV